MISQSALWRESLINLVKSFIIFSALLLILYLAEQFFVDLRLLKWHDAAWCVGVPASIIGVAYVLTIRNPLNYIGFYGGIVMSALLSLQFYLQGNYDLSLLYILVFIPFQIKSILFWRSSGEGINADDQKPEYLTSKQRLLSLLIFFAIVVADYYLSSRIISPVEDITLLDKVVYVFGALLIASSVFANYWLIYRKTDAWFYWIVYSFCGIVLYAVIGNAFNLVLFTFFLVINSMAGIAWVRETNSGKEII